MSAVIATSQTFKIDQISDADRERAIEQHRDINSVDDWFKAVFEDARTRGVALGIEIDRIYFSGFCSQGDGTCSESTHRYELGILATIKAHATNDTALHQVARDLRDIQKTYQNSLTVCVKQSGRYMHSGCADSRADYDTELVDENDLELRRARMHRRRRIVPDVNPVGICEAVEALLTNNKTIEAAFNAAIRGQIPILCNGYNLRTLPWSKAKLRELWQLVALRNPIRPTASYQNTCAPLAF